MMQQEKEELKLILSAIVSSLGNACSEYLLRKTYQSDEGENIDVKLRKVRKFIVKQIPTSLPFVYSSTLAL